MNGANDNKAEINCVEGLQINNDCRICFEKCNDVWQIFHPTNEEIPRKLMEFASVQVEENDGLPGTICHNCRRLLDVSYDFKCQVEQSDAKFREILMLKDSTEEDEKILSLSQSVNEAITEAIADEIAHNRETNGECKGLVNSLTDRTNHHMEDELSEHHYATHHEQIIFRIEPPPDHDDQCVLEESLTSMRTEACNVKDEKNLDLGDCGKNPVDVLIDKYDELANITGERYKTELMILSANESEDDTNDGPPENFERIDFETDNAKKKDPREASIKAENHFRGSSKEESESDEEGKPFVARSQRLKCPNCIKTFATKTLLDRHAEIHNKKTHLRYVCYMCDKQFGTIAKLKNHVSVCHDPLQSDETVNVGEEDRTSEEKQLVNLDNKKNTKYGCSICGKNFTYQKSFLTHAKTHPGYEPENIIVNDDSVAASEESNEHNGHETDDEDRPLEGLQCTQCGKLFANKRNLRRHTSTHIGLKYHCSSCSKEFSRIDKLKEHQQSKHKEEFFATSDSDSDEDMDNENKNHDASESRKKEKLRRPHKCRLCDKAFAQEQSLMNHIERHQRVKDTQKRFLCEVCSKCFAQSGSLVAHMRTHTGVKPYVCNVCTRGFTKSTYLQLHLRTHSGEKPYICQYCSRAFARANTLARHITVHTGEAKYHCQVCTKSFRRLTSLNEHTYTHTGQRPYACKICGKRYNNGGSLYAHSKKCKAQQVTGTMTFTIPADNEIDQNGDSGSQIMIYEQRKLSEDSSVDQVSPTSQFIISNPQNPSLKTLPNNIIPQFTVEEPNFCNVNAKSYKTPYYTIYPNM